MEIIWLGHSCFRIKGSQAGLITDPYSPELGYSLGKQSARIVTVSHNHPGHSYTQGIGGDPKVITGPGEYEISDVLIIGMDTFHDAEKGAQRGKNTVYIIQIDDMTVCHLGDLGHMLTSDQLEELEAVDILMVPVGGRSTINAPVASEIIRQVEPKVVLPMHYQTDALKRELDPVSNFLSDFGSEMTDPQPKVSYTRANLPVSTQVVLLDYA